MYTFARICTCNLCPTKKAQNYQKPEVHQQQERANLKMQALKEIPNNALLLFYEGSYRFTTYQDARRVGLVDGL